LKTNGAMGITWDRCFFPLLSCLAKLLLSLLSVEVHCPFLFIFPALAGVANDGHIP
jgi:hypothetical protein